jgi:hypothetical protein
MGAASSVAIEAGGGFLSKLQAVGANKNVQEEKKHPEDDDDDEDAVDTNDLEELQKAYRNLGYKRESDQEKIQALQFENKTLRSKLNELMTAIKQLSSELNTTKTEKEAMEAHLAQMANPEREAYMHKYALEKLHEEFEIYKKETAEKEGHLNRELRRLAENLANRAAADDAAKASMQAEIRELKSHRGLLQFFDGKLVAPEAAQESRRSPRSPKGAKGSGSPKGTKKEGKTDGKYPVADFEPHAGLKPKTQQVERAAGVVVEVSEGEVLDTHSEAMAKRKEAAARTGREFLIAQGVLPPDEAVENFDGDQDLQLPLPKIIEFVMDPEAATEMFDSDSYLQVN